MSESDYQYTLISTKSSDDKSNVDIEFPRYFLGSTIEEAQDTFNAFKSYINNISIAYSGLVQNISKDDLFSECVFALAKAKKDFDSKRSSDFKAYAKYIIVDALREYIRKNRAIVQVPSYINKANITIVKLKKLLNNSSLWYDLVFNREDVTEEIDHHKKILLSAAKRAKITSEQLVERAEFLPVVNTEEQTIDGSESPYDETESILAKVVVDKIFTSLSEDEKVVAELTMQDLNKTEIAKTIGRSIQFVDDKLKAIKSKVLEMIIGEGNK